MPDATAVVSHHNLLPSRTEVCNFYRTLFVRNQICKQKRNLTSFKIISKLSKWSLMHLYHLCGPACTPQLSNSSWSFTFSGPSHGGENLMEADFMHYSVGILLYLSLFLFLPISFKVVQRRLNVSAEYPERSLSWFPTAPFWRVA